MSNCSDGINTTETKQQRAAYAQIKLEEFQHQLNMRKIQTDSLYYRGENEKEIMELYINGDITKKDFIEALQIEFTMIADEIEKVRADAGIR